MEYMAAGIGSLLGSLLTFFIAGLFVLGLLEWLFRVRKNAK